MIEFNDSFTQVAVAQAMSAHGDLPRLITYQLTFPKWAHDYDETGKRTGPDKIKPLPTMHKTTLFVSPLDMVENLPREINFAWWERECNDLGYPVGEWRRTIVGAYVNHGSNDKPDWSSHT